MGVAGDDEAVAAVCSTDVDRFTSIQPTGGDRGCAVSIGTGLPFTASSTARRLRDDCRDGVHAKASSAQRL